MLISNLAGKNYKNIYSQKKYYKWLDRYDIDNNKVAMDLHDKYIGIEKKILEYKGGTFDSYMIAFHGAYTKNYGGRLHLEFDTLQPVIHLISYDTDVADYNIKTGVMFMGETYSMTTKRHLSDFKDLFDYKKCYTGINCDITNNSRAVNLVDSLNQFRPFNIVLSAISDSNVFKYMKKQETEILLVLLDNADFNVFNILTDSDFDNDKAIDYLRNAYKFMFKDYMYKGKDNNEHTQYSYIIESVYNDVNGNKNFKKSFDNLKDIFRCVFNAIYSFKKVA